MYDDPCPNCGHRRKRTLMSTDPDGPSLAQIFSGASGMPMAAIAWFGTMVIATLVLTQIMVMVA